MKRVFITLLLFATLFSTATAQYSPIDTALLNKTYRTLLQNPQLRESQLDFLRHFLIIGTILTLYTDTVTRMGMTCQLQPSIPAHKGSRGMLCNKRHSIL